jgi:hypothetical protein
MQVQAYNLMTRQEAEVILQKTFKFSGSWLKALRDVLKSGLLSVTDVAGQCSLINNSKADTSDFVCLPVYRR